MPGINEEKRMRLQWAANFEPEALSKTEIKENKPQESFDGGDCWENEDG